MPRPRVVGAVSNLRDRRARHDLYYRRARDQGFAARSVFKLEEIDRRLGLLDRGQRILDLGCRPGSWLRYAAERVGPEGHVVGLDREALDITLPSNATVVLGDVRVVEPAALAGALPPPRRGCFHVVLSDLAPDTTGVAATDQARSLELFLRALDLARDLGCPGGAFVGKLFMGEGYAEAAGRVKQQYARSRTLRPDATRRSSSEVYLVGMMLRGRT